jgi:hypothetical protein
MDEFAVAGDECADLFHCASRRGFDQGLNSCMDTSLRMQ